MWEAYERHAIDNSNIEVEDYNVTCDHSYNLGEQAAEQECKEACWGSDCEGYTFEESSGCVDGEICTIITADVYIGTKSTGHPKRLGDYYVFGRVDGAYLKVVYTDLNLQTVGTKDIQADITLVTLESLDQYTFDSAPERRITGSAYSSSFPYSQYSTLPITAYNVAGYGTLVGGSCQGQPYQYCGWLAYGQSGSSCDYDTRYASGSYCIGNVVSGDIVNNLHKLQNVCSGPCVPANLLEDFPNADDLINAIDCSESCVPAAKLYVDGTMYNPPFPGAESPTYSVNKYGDILFMYASTSFNDHRIIRVNTTLGTTEIRKKGFFSANHLVTDDWTYFWSDADVSSELVVLDFDTCQGYKECGSDTGPVYRLKKDQVTEDFDNFSSKWGGFECNGNSNCDSKNYCRVHQDCVPGQFWDGSCVPCDKHAFGNAECTEGSPCEANPCQNGGICYGDGECLCPAEYSGSMCQNKDTLSCEGGNTDIITKDINGVATCNCKPGYYGDRCQFSAHCQDGMTMTSEGCILNCDIDVSYQCACGTELVSEGHCINGKHRESCVSGAQDCYDGSQICTHYGESCTTYFTVGCEIAGFDEYDPSVINVTIITCATQGGVVVNMDEPCTLNSDCEAKGCVNGFCAQSPCVETNKWWNGTECVEYSPCPAGFGSIPSKYSDSDCTEVCDDWTNGHVCAAYGDVSTCTYYEPGNSNTDHVCYEQIACTKDENNIFYQLGDECIECMDGYVEQDQTGKEICIGFSTCEESEYAIRNGNEDVTCTARTTCSGVKTSSAYEDTICVDDNVPTCTQAGIDYPDVNFKGRQDLIGKGIISPENVAIALEYCSHGTSFEDANGGLVTVHKDGQLDTKGTYAYYETVRIGNITVDGSFPCGTTRGETVGTRACVDTFVDFPGGCLHGTVETVEEYEYCSGLTSSVSQGFGGPKFDVVEGCDLCENGTCTDNILSCECYEGADGFYCKDIVDCPTSCGYASSCIEGNRTFTCECSASLDSQVVNGICEYDCAQCVTGHCASCDTDGPICEVGWSGTHCDECAPGYVGESCVICPAETKSSGGVCVPCADGYDSLAGASICFEAVCVNGQGDDCDCDAGWEGKWCTVDIDECVDESHNCDTNAQCTDIDGSFSCECNSGYSGNGVTCTDIDECALGTDTCSENAACDNKDGSFDCTCNPDFSGDGVTCTKNDDCDPDLCVHGTCEDGINSYTCNCGDTGFTGTICDKCAKGSGYNTVSEKCEACGLRYVNNVTHHEAHCNLLNCEEGYGHTLDTDQWDNTDSSPDSGNCIECTGNTVSPGGHGPCVEVICDHGHTIKATLNHTEGADNCDIDIELLTSKGNNNARINALKGVHSRGSAEAKNYRSGLLQTMMRSKERPSTQSRKDFVKESRLELELADLSVTTRSKLPSKKVVNRVFHSMGPRNKGVQVTNWTQECANGDCCHIDFSNQTASDLQVIDPDEEVDSWVVACNGIVPQCMQTRKAGGFLMQTYVDGWDNGEIKTDGVYQCGSNVVGIGSMQGICVSDIDCNGGTCNTDGGCDCATGYSGDSCETNIDECAPVPCKNGGTCHDGVNSFTCTCAAGYSGDTCETNIDDCSPNPCKNDAGCTDKVNDYECSCTAGWEGKNCNEDKDYCEPDICGVHGVCTETPTSYVCDCEKGFQWKDNECVCGLGKGYNGTHCATCLHATYNLVTTHDEPCHEHQCAPGSRPVNTASSVCEECPEGQTSDGLVCEDIQCTAETCANGDCVDNECVCKQGYGGSPCQELDTACDFCKEGTCVEDGNALTCDCHSGFMGIGCGISHADFCAATIDPSEYINNQCCSC